MANPVAAEDGPSREYPWLDEIMIKIDNLSPIPFFVLERLYSQVVESSTIGQSLPGLPELALGFFKSVLRINDENFRIIRRRPYPHLLDLIHNCYLPPALSGRSNIGEWVSTQRATSLDEAGIVFRKGCCARFLLCRTMSGFELKLQGSAGFIQGDLEKDLFQKSMDNCIGHGCLLSSFSWCNSNEQENTFTDDLTSISPDLVFHRAKPLRPL
ncbi:hypothetical protein D5086_025099 [Populus alba]|uniref:Uncharacterized protein n=1 Tax=Populus alba TaxID=43335 RepID=A0ACC4B814_POPAL